MNSATTQIGGRLTRDVETKTVGDNLTIATFSVAVNTKKKVAGQYEDHASFYDVTLIGKRAENFAKFHKKGDLCFVTGTLIQDRWEAKDGTKRSKVVVQGQDWCFVSGGKADEGERQPVETTLGTDTPF